MEKGLAADEQGMTDPLEQMRNTGLCSVLDDSIVDQPEKTLVVLGIARGGTSAIAGALHELGIFTGALSAGPVFEDVNLSASIESGTAEDVQRIIDEYNGQHKVWAYKRPRLLYHVADVHAQFRNPVYIVIFRDVFAAAQRTRISGGVDIFLTMKKLLADTGRIVDFIDSRRPNVILVSYEKLLAHPELLVDELIKLSGTGASEDARLAAIASIRPAPDDYLDATRTNKAAGRISRVSDDCVEGWARYTYPLKPAAEVELSINGSVIAQTTAELDIPDTGMPPGRTEGSYCGFRFQLQPGTISNSDQLAVRATDDITELENSPLTAELPVSALGKLGRWLRRS
ncbi:MAG: hypothetical protein ABJ308_10495 [Halieaceae bacterium]